MDPSSIKFVCTFDESQWSIKPINSDLKKQRTSNNDFKIIVSSRFINNFFGSLRGACKRQNQPNGVGGNSVEAFKKF